MLLVILPLAHAGVVAVGIYIFITSWNEYLFALMLTGEHVRTVTVALQLFIGENQIQWGLLMAGGTAGGAARDHPVPLRAASPGERPDRRSGERMTNPIGVISMSYARPFTARALPAVRAHEGGRHGVLRVAGAGARRTRPG